MYKKQNFNLIVENFLFLIKRNLILQGNKKTIKKMNIERIREICLQLPHTSEGIKYGDQLCFMVVSKVFCSAQIYHLDRIKFKVHDEDFELLCDREGITPAPYGGARFKWVQIADFAFLTEREWLFFIQQSYQLIKASLPKKVLGQLDTSQ